MTQRRRGDVAPKLSTEMPRLTHSGRIEVLERRLVVPFQLGRQATHEESGEVIRLGDQDLIARFPLELEAGIEFGCLCQR